MVLPQEAKIAYLTGEMLFFGLLGKLLYADLDKTWLQHLVEEDVFAETPFGEKNTDITHGLEFLQAWSRNNMDGISKEHFEDLLAEYTNLFAGGKVLAAPWESVYFGDDRLIFQEQTLEVRSWYKRFDLESEKIHREPDDHIGLEMLFLSHLASLSAQALTEQDNNRAEELVNAQREFMKEHLGVWALTWCNLVERHARTDFYRGLVYLTRGAVCELAEALDVQLLNEVVQ